MSHGIGNINYGNIEATAFFKIDPKKVETKSSFHFYKTK